MEYRLAIEADTREVLLQRLEGFIDNQAATGVHIGQVKRSLEACSPGNDATLFEEDSDAQSLLHIWCQKKNLAKIAQIWVRGVSVDWKLLYDVGRGLAPLRPARGPLPTSSALPRRVSLPTYPFARKRYWIPTASSTAAATFAQHLTARAIPQSELGASASVAQSTQIPTMDNTNENGKISRGGGDPPILFK